MNKQELAEFIAAIPDLTSHRFMDTDGYFSVKIHEPHEVAERVAEALAAAKYAVVPHVIVVPEPDDFELPWASG